MVKSLHLKQVIWASKILVDLIPDCFFEIIFFEPLNCLIKIIFLQFFYILRILLLVNILGLHIRVLGYFSLVHLFSMMLILVLDRWLLILNFFILNRHFDIFLILRNSLLILLLIIWQVFIWNLLDFDIESSLLSLLNLFFLRYSRIIDIWIIFITMRQSLHFMYGLLKKFLLSL